MSEFSKQDILKIYKMSDLYLKQKYPNGTTIAEIITQEDLAFKQYVKFWSKSVSQGKTRYNRKCERLRVNWFVLESILKIMKMNKLNNIENLNFCFENFDQQSNLFTEYLKTEIYKSYLDDLEK